MRNWSREGLKQFVHLKFLVFLFLQKQIDFVYFPSLFSNEREGNSKMVFGRKKVKFLIIIIIAKVKKMQRHCFLRVLSRLNGARPRSLLAGVESQQRPPRRRCVRLQKAHKTLWPKHRPVAVVTRTCTLRNLQTRALNRHAAMCHFLLARTVLGFNPDCHVQNFDIIYRRSSSDGQKFVVCVL